METKKQVISITMSPLLYLLLAFWFPFSNLFIAQKIRNKTEEAPFGIPGMSTESENGLRAKPIVESDIGFLL